MKKLILKKSGRVVNPFPWKASSAAPWGNRYERVLIPTVPADNTEKPFHVQIVRKDKLEVLEKGRPKT